MKDNIIHSLSMLKITTKKESQDILNKISYLVIYRIRRGRQISQNKSANKEYFEMEDLRKYKGIRSSYQLNVK